MAKKIRNMNDLSKAFIPILKGMIREEAEIVYQTLNYFLLEYYNGYDPISYRRQYGFLRSAVKVEPKVSGNKVTSYVYIDTDSMENYYNASGIQVATWANKGLHGGMKAGNKIPHVWDDTIRTTIGNGDLLRLAVNYLRSQGITVQIR